MEIRFGLALLVLVVIALLWQDIYSWAFLHPEHWYRPYLIWLALIGCQQFVRLESRRRHD